MPDRRHMDGKHMYGHNIEEDLEGIDGDILDIYLNLKVRALCGRELPRGETRVVPENVTCVVCRVRAYINHRRAQVQMERLMVLGETDPGETCALLVEKFGPDWKETIEQGIRAHKMMASRFRSH